jgi:hypothetical protein
VDAALNKGTIAWIGVPKPGGGDITKPVWYGYDRGVVYVLTGGDEQKVPGLVESNSARVMVRSKDKQSLVGEMECSVRKVPKGPEWELLARDLLIGRRLNLQDGDKAIERWRKHCEIVALTPIPPEMVAAE